MKEEELKELSLAFNDVFDSNGEVKNCGRAACMKLIAMMKNYTSRNVGDEKTGMMNKETMKAEYHRICG